MIGPFFIWHHTVLDVLRHVQDKWAFLCFELPKSFADAVVDIVGVIDPNRRLSCELRQCVLVDHPLRIVGVAQ